MAPNPHQHHHSVGRPQLVIAPENARLTQEGGTKFSAQPLPQPGEGCRESYVEWHSYSNGVPISKTEVAITIGGQIVAGHPKFEWNWDDIDGRKELRGLLEEIFDTDLRYIERSSRPRRRRV
jgi:hypothetical protein